MLCSIIKELSNLFQATDCINEVDGLTMHLTCYIKFKSKPVSYFMSIEKFLVSSACTDLEFFSWYCIT